MALSDPTGYYVDDGGVVVTGQAGGDGGVTVHGGGGVTFTNSPGGGTYINDFVGVIDVQMPTIALGDGACDSGGSSCEFTDDLSFDESGTNPFAGLAMSGIMLVSSGNSGLAGALSVAQKGDGFFKGLWKKATGWHFEGRDASNAPYENTPFDALVVDGQVVDKSWTRMTGSQAQYHDNGDAFPEWKLVHTSGAELVFDGKTHELITSAQLKGTYNYINAVAIQDVNSMGSAAAFVYKGLGHFAVDVVPYWMGGNVRGSE